MADKDNSSVLVTGAGGFIGRAVTALLERSGVSVVLLDQSSALASCSERAGQKIACDVSRADKLEQVFAEKRISGIIHLAAVLPTAAQRDPLRATEVNVQGSVNLLEAARKFGVKRFVFGSSLSIYGSWPDDHVVSEADRAAPEDLYGAAKLYVEQLGSAYAGSHGLEFVSLRIGRVIGEGARSATSAWRSEIFEFLRQGRPAIIRLPYVDSERVLLVHVQDVAKMLVTLVEARRLSHPVYNALCESVLIKDLKRLIEALNPNVSVRVGEDEAPGNPRRVDSSRFQKEFEFVTLPFAEQLRRAAER
jgi:nucleoside-diphosphate-sugar epimerase